MRVHLFGHFADLRVGISFDFGSDIFSRTHVLKRRGTDSHIRARHLRFFNQKPTYLSFKLFELFFTFLPVLLDFFLRFFLGLL
jgi:hypothetical protein